MGFTIIVDSCCDLTPEMRADPVFRVIPLTIRVDGRDFLDNEHLLTKDLLDAMAQSSGPSSSSCPAPGDYLDAYRAAEGDIYVVTLSAMLSGSHNSARQGAALLREEQPDRNIHIFNSCSASAGEVLLARKIFELARSGMAFPEVVRQADQTVREMNTLFVLENLDNLKKNGRLTKVQALLTGALRIKLVMGSTPEGEICKHAQALSIRQALGKLVEIMRNDPLHVGKSLVISHCHCLERANLLRDMVEKSCVFDRVLITATGGLSSYYANAGGVIAAY